MIQESGPVPPARGPAPRAPARDQVHSPSIRKTSRLVAEDRDTRAQANQRFDQCRRCINQVFAVIQRSAKPLSGDRPSNCFRSRAHRTQSLNPSTPATADGTRVGSDSDASSTNHPPSMAKLADNMPRRASRASVVFPDAALVPSGSRCGRPETKGPRKASLHRSQRRPNEAM